MPFIWVGCADGSSVDMNKISAFSVGQVPKHDTEGNPMFSEGITGPDGTVTNREPISQMCVFAIIDQHTFPVRVVRDMNEAQLAIQSMLGKLKKMYDAERGGVVEASIQEKVALKLG